MKNVLLFILIVSVIPGLCSSVGPVARRPFRRQTKACKEYEEFSCRAGDCISVYDACNGVQNCPDGSDETDQACREVFITSCPSKSFRCDYGACISLSLRCDDKMDCSDGSDESGCNKTSSNSQNSSVCNDEFLCRDGSCINLYLVCDGVRHCPDGSDETTAACRQLSITSCPSKQWRCAYGACLRLSTRCNGRQDCWDGSDEANCKTTTTTTTRPVDPVVALPPGRHCRLPDQPSHGYHVRVTSCAAGDQSAACHNVPGAAVSPYWLLKYTCYHNYELSSYNPYSVCDNGVWTPSLRCYKLCPALKSISADVTCIHSGVTVSCNVPLRPGTTATAHCKQYYHYESPPQDLLCQENGQWNERLQKCAPNCGVSIPEGAVEPQILHGKVTKRGEFPWLAAIYHQNKSNLWDQVCGGTLITPHMVLTAAHCVIVNGVDKAVEDFKVGLGKYFRDYYRTEKNSVIVDVREISYPSKYFGSVDLYALDIALLDLEHSVQINTFVMPACVDWSANYVRPVSSETIGNVAGWGTTENTKSSDVILSAQLTYVGTVQCKRRFLASIHFIVNDKFCAASISGSQTLKGDSGGGYTVVRNTLHFVLGVVSVKSKTGTEFSMFTDMSNPQHRDWLNNRRRYFSNIHRDEL